MKKRILSLLLAAVFLCALTGVTVQAAEEGEPRKLLEIHSYWDDNEPSVTRLHYNEDTGLLARISFSGFGYEREDLVFTYDEHGRLIQVSSGDKEQDFYSYVNLKLHYGDQGRFQSWEQFSVIYNETYGECVYADNGNMIRAAVQQDYPLDILYFCDANGRVSEVEETYLSFENPTTTKTQYYYDKEGRISQKSVTDGYGDLDHFYYFYDYQGFEVEEGPYGITARYDAGVLPIMDPYVRDLLWSWNFDPLTFYAYDDAELIAEDGYLLSITGTVNQGANETHVEFVYEPKPEPEVTVPATEAPVSGEPKGDSGEDSGSGDSMDTVIGAVVIAAGAYLLGTRKNKKKE